MTLECEVKTHTHTPHAAVLCDTEVLSGDKKRHTACLVVVSFASASAVSCSARAAAAAGLGVRVNPVARRPVAGPFFRWRPQPVPWRFPFRFPFLLWPQPRLRRLGGSGILEPHSRPPRGNLLSGEEMWAAQTGFVPPRQRALGGAARARLCADERGTPGREPPVSTCHNPGTASTRSAAPTTVIQVRLALQN